MTKTVSSVDVFEWAGMVTGLLGSAFLATNTNLSGYGFVPYLASNILWIYAGIRRHNLALVSMMACYTLVSLYGVYRWFLG